MLHRLRRASFALLTGLVMMVPLLVTATAAEAIGSNAVRPGFDSQSLAGNDDGSTATIPLQFPINFYGSTFNSVYVNNNGNLTFTGPLATYTPFGLSGAATKIIAPFFADVLTTTGATTHYGAGTVDGRPAFGATWPGVHCYGSASTSGLNNFQAILIDRSDIDPGDFDIEFNYDRITWETGTASGGNAQCDGGNSVHIGYSNGSAASSYELPGSGVAGSFLDGGPLSLISHSLNSSQAGRYVFGVRSGAPAAVTSLSTTLSDGQHTGTSLTEAPGQPVTATSTIGNHSADAGGSVTYSVYSDPSCVTKSADAGTVTVTNGSVPSSTPVGLGSGTYYWQSVYSGDHHNNGSSSPCGATVQTVDKLGQTVAFSSIPPSPAIFGGSYTPTATSDSGLPVALSLTRDSVGCSLSDGTVSFSGVGTCVLAADQAGDALHDAAPTQYQQVSIAPAPQDVTFTSSAPNAHVGDSYTPTARGGASGSPVTISTDPSSTGCSMDNSLVTFTHAGECVLEATQAGTATYALGADTQRVTVGKADQAVKFTSTPAAPSNGGRYQATASGGPTGEPITFAAGDNSAGCTVNRDGQVTFTAAGTCVIVANQGGNGDYNPGGATQSFAVAPGAQAITFTASAPAAPTYGEGFQAAASGGRSGNPVTFSADPASAGCTVAQDGAVRFTGVGSCIVDADQAGDADYAAAPQVSQTFTVLPAQLRIQVDDASRVYHLGNPMLSGTINGAVAGDSFTGTYATPGRGPETVVGSYRGAIVPTLSGDHLADYNVTVTGGTLTVTPMPTQLTITSAPTRMSTGPTAVSASLTEALTHEPVAAEAVRFTAGSATATGTSNPASVNLPLPIGRYALGASFSGDPNYTASSAGTQTLYVYQPTSFVVWGGNPGGLISGSRYNFWGAQWAKQVAGGDYQAGSAFKGWADTVSTDGASFTATPGNSTAPVPAVSSYIGVLVADHIKPSATGFTGSALRTAVLQVANPASYGPDPGKAGYGILMPTG